MEKCACGKTALENAVNDILNKLGIAFVNRYPVGSYVVDTYLPDYNLAIEVMDDYWHANPLLFPVIRQFEPYQQVLNDIQKAEYVVYRQDIPVLYLWEQDITTNVPLCTALIRCFVEEEGKLSEYHSFNYSLWDDVLIEHTKRIRPFQEYCPDEVPVSLKKQSATIISYNTSYITTNP